MNQELYVWTKVLDGEVIYSVANHSGHGLSDDWTLKSGPYVDYVSAYDAIHKAEGEAK